MKVWKSTVERIKKQNDEINVVLNDNGDILVVVQKRKRVKITAKFHEIEKIIIVYIKKMLERRLPITGPVLCDLVG